MKSSPLVFAIVRYALYSVFVGLAVAWLMRRAAVEANGDSFVEGSAVEWLQFALAGATVLVLGLGAWTARRGRLWLVCAGLLGAIALVREMDYLFDAWIPVLGWQLPAFVLLLVAAWCLCRVIRQSNPRDDILGTPALGILWCGWLTVVVFAQVAGEAEPWKAIMADQYDRNFKRVVEELIEAVGYMLLCAGSIELVLEARRAPHEAPATDALESQKPETAN